MRIPLPAGWGEARLCGSSDHRPEATGTVRSYDHTGTRLVWSPPENGCARFACDIEHDARLSGELAHLLHRPADRLGRDWALTETLAKLLNVPILAWLKRSGLERAPEGETAETDAIAFGSSGAIAILLRRFDSRTLAFGMLTKPGKGF